MSGVPLKLTDLFRESGAKSSNMIAGAREHLELKLENPPKLGWQELESHLGNALNEMLDIDVLDVLCGAWIKVAELREYRDLKAHPANETAFFNLYKHAIHSEHEPTIRVFYGEKEVARLKFGVDVELEVAAATLKIQKGRITEIMSGEFTMSGEISLGGKELLKKAAGPYKIAGRISMGEGVEIPAL